MTRSFTRTLLAPALLAVAIAPLALSASATPGGEDGKQGWSKEHRQQHEQRRATLQQRLTELVDSWELSEADREALRDARKAVYADMQALREGDVGSRQERREAVRELREEHHEALAEILSDEQIEEMRTVISRHGKNAGGRQGKGDDDAN